MTTEYPVSSTAKLANSGKVYARQVYATGRVEYVSYDIDDPAQNEEPSSFRAYRACTGLEQVIL